MKSIEGDTKSAACAQDNGYMGGRDKGRGGEIARRKTRRKEGTAAN